MKRTRLIAVVTLPLLGLAALAAVLAFDLWGNEKAQANPNAGVEFHIQTGGCSTIADTKGLCSLPLGGSFVVEGVIDSFGPPLTDYDGIAMTLNYVGVTSKDNPSTASWPNCVFGVSAGQGSGTFINGGCSIGIAQPSSTHTGVFFTNTFNCTNDGAITVFHDKAGTAITDSTLTSHTEVGNGPDVLNIDCQPIPPTATFTPTSTPPPVPRVQKDCNADEPGVQPLCNEWLERQGAKIPPVRCDDSTDVASLTETISSPISTFNQKGEPQSLAAFEFEVRFDWTKICVNLVPSAQWQALINTGDAICYVMDKDTSTLEGIARIGCVSVGKGHQAALDGLELATIEVRPQPEMYSQMRPNQDNGNPVQIMNQGCELADEQGHAAPIFSCEDADITFRYLEGDVDGPDCDVDVYDAQSVAFRWGVNKGSLLYKSFMDLEPSGQVKGDGDIDIKDVQFVFGRFGSTCDAPHPPQPAVNPKAFGAEGED